MERVREDNGIIAHGFSHGNGRIFNIHDGLIHSVKFRIRENDFQSYEITFHEQ